MSTTPTEDAKKKKKERPPPPPCPAAVSTAVLLLRAAVYAVTGAHLSESNPPSCSLLQATYLKEPLTGKFSIGFGKRSGGDCCSLPITADQQANLLEAIAGATKRLLRETTSITCYTTTIQQALATYGASCFDGSHTKQLKSAADGSVPVAVVRVGETILVAAVPPSTPLAASSIADIVLDVTQCSVVGGAKAKKAEVSLKFAVVLKDETAAEDLAVVQATPLPARPPVTKGTILAPEGIELKESIAKQEEQALAAAKATEEQAAATAAEDEEMVVNIEEVKGKVDYNKLVEQFGSTLIDDKLLQEFQSVTGTPRLHRWLRRGMFFSHRDLHTFVRSKQKGTPVYLYTGRGPSSSAMHLGHLIPFLFTQWLQEVLDAPLVIQMTDDEKFIFKGEYADGQGDDLQRFANLTIENAKDIIACGFDYKKTFIFSDLDYVGKMYPNIVRIWKAVTMNQVCNTFGFEGSSAAGKVAFPAVQAAPSFASSFPEVLQVPDNRGPAANRLCLIPCAIDQDPYFRMTRDIAHKLVDHAKHDLSGKPALLHSKFFPPLQGATGKMSSSDTNSAIFLTDTPEEIQRKIRNHAFSGGQDTQALQKEKGADLEVDVSYQWLRFFLEDDDELEAIGKDYSTGQGKYWSTSAVKDRLIDVLQTLVAEHQKRRALITDEEVRKWMKERSIV